MEIDTILYKVVSHSFGAAACILLHILSRNVSNANHDNIATAAPPEKEAVVLTIRPKIDLPDTDLCILSIFMVTRAVTRPVMASRSEKKAYTVNAMPVARVDLAMSVAHCNQVLMNGAHKCWCALKGGEDDLPLLRYIAIQDRWLNHQRSHCTGAIK
jgi:hypothetical protein